MSYLKRSYEYDDYSDRNGSKSLLSKVTEFGLITLLTLFIASLVGSAIWGAEGFVEVLASFF